MNLFLFKTCTKCGNLKPFVDFFNHKHCKDGKNTVCKDCLRQYHQQPDVLSKHAECERRRREKMGDTYRANERERNKKRKEQRDEYNHEYYKLHKDECIKRDREYRHNNRHVENGIKHRRRARILGLPATLTEADWESILQKWNYSCSYCGKSNVKLFRDHDLPTTRGGGYTADNIRPACGSCNSRKHTLTADEFIAKIRKDEK